MNIYPATLPDLLYMSMHMRELDKIGILAQLPTNDLEAWVFERWKSDGPKFTLYDEQNLPVACAGVVIYRAGLGTAWFVARDDFSRFRFSVFRKAKEVLNKCLTEKLVHRLQAECLDCKIAKEFLIKLGFEYEGRLRKIGRNKEDFCLYARTE